MIEKFWETVQNMGGGLALLIGILIVVFFIVAFMRLKAPRKPQDKSNPAGEAGDG